MSMVHSMIVSKNPTLGTKYNVIQMPVPMNSYANNSIDFNLLLKLLNDELQILEKTRLTPQDFPYEAYGRAKLFIKLFFVLLRILMDDITGTIEYFYKVNERINIPSSFTDLLKKAKIKKLPEDLAILVKLQESWFNELKAKREGIVHNYDDILISFQAGSNGRNKVGHFNTKHIRHYIYPDTRKYIGSTLSNYQRFIDDLLDFLDVKLGVWYGLARSAKSRHLTVIADEMPLWWAHKYGDYKNANLIISDNFEPTPKPKKF